MFVSKTVLSFVVIVTSGCLYILHCCKYYNYLCLVAIGIQLVTKGTKSNNHLDVKKRVNVACLGLYVIPEGDK